jgi:hypothetical protein
MKRNIVKRPQSAYIFGGMEAIIFQGLIAGFLGGMLVVAGYWRRFKAYISEKWQRIKAYFSVDTPKNKQDRSEN